MSNRTENVLHLGKTPTTTVLKLAWPTIVEQTMYTVLNFSDTAMVGVLGAASTAAVGLTSTSIWLSGSVIVAVSVGLSVQIAQAVGAGNAKQAQRVLDHVLPVCSVFGLLLFLVFFSLSGFLPAWLGGEADVIPLARQYLQVISLSRLFDMFSSVFSSSLRCMGDTHTPLRINFSAIALNIFFNFMLIYPTRPFSIGAFSFVMPGAGLGVAGAAWGTVLAVMFSSLALGFSLVRGKRSARLCLPRGFRPDRRILINMLRLGIPTAMEEFITTSGQVAATRIVSTLGTVAVAANHLAVSAESLSYMPAYGVSVATTTLVSQSIGAEDRDGAMNFGRIANRIGFCAMIFVGVLLFLFAEPLIRLFTHDETVVMLAAAMLRIVAIAQPLTTSYSILSGALRGAGDARGPFIIGACCMWGLRLTLSCLFVFVFHWGLYGIWIAMIIDNMTRGIWIITRWNRGRWKENSALLGPAE
ncbi:MAG: MATE family efflux transporter [Oscillospiraceae bacterium]|nr:MATE family efflux transporter [Oscillospiraceae bacterium]